MKMHYWHCLYDTRVIFYFQKNPEQFKLYTPLAKKTILFINTQKHSGVLTFM